MEEAIAARREEIQDAGKKSGSVFRKRSCASNPHGVAVGKCNCLIERTWTAEYGMIRMAKDHQEG
jgi:hypothetical protein